MENEEVIVTSYVKVHNELMIKSMKVRFAVEAEFPKNSFPTLEEVEASGDVCNGLPDELSISLENNCLWRLHQAFALEMFDPLMAYVKECCGDELQQLADGSKCTRAVRKCLDLCKYLFDWFQLGERSELAAFMPDIHDGYEKILMLNDDYDIVSLALFYRVMYEVLHMVDAKFSPCQLIACVVRSGCTPTRPPHHSCACAVDSLTESVLTMVSVMVTQGSLSEQRETARSIVTMCADSGNCVRWRYVIAHVRREHADLCVTRTVKRPESQTSERCVLFIAQCDNELADMKARVEHLDRKRKRCQFMRALAEQSLESEQ